MEFPLDFQSRYFWLACPRPNPNSKFILLDLAFDGASMHNGWTF